MKIKKKIKNFLDLEKIDISILNESEKQVIHGGYNSQVSCVQTQCNCCPQTGAMSCNPITWDCTKTVY